MFEFELCVAAVSGSSRGWDGIWMIVDGGVTPCDLIFDFGIVVERRNDVCCVLQLSLAARTR